MVENSHKIDLKKTHHTILHRYVIVLAIFLAFTHYFENGSFELIKYLYIFIPFIIFFEGDRVTPKIYWNEEFFIIKNLLLFIPYNKIVTPIDQIQHIKMSKNRFGYDVMELKTTKEPFLQIPILHLQEDDVMEFINFIIHYNKCKVDKDVLIFYNL